MTAQLFVYGTLVPDGKWYDVVARYVLDHHPARVAGRLYDTGRGYPAATFTADAHDTEVAGYVLTLTDPERALELLDRFEGEEYERVEVRTTDGTVAVSYQWRGERAGLRTIASGRWPIS